MKAKLTLPKLTALEGDIKSNVDFGNLISA